MQDAFGFSNTQLGVLSSTFGFTSLIGYFPGGWLADRFSSRKLISVALVITAAGAFVFLTMPSFEICVLLFGLWGIATACVFWSAMIKATRNWASSAEQGRAFGILEGGRKFVDMASAALLLAIFAFRGGDDAALSEIIQILAVSTLVLAVLVWTVMKDASSHDDYREEPPTHTAAGIIEVLKLPIVWMMAIIIRAAYSGLWGAIYLTPYATEVYELGSILGGAIGVGKLWLAALAAIAAGFIADKIGTAKAIVRSFVLMTSGFLIFGLLPGGPSLVPLLLMNGALISCAVYGLRGIYVALLEQGGVPVAITGTVTGVVSVIGYMPDMFLPVLGGMILDASPGADGYQNLFRFVAALNVLGLTLPRFPGHLVKIHCRSRISGCGSCWQRGALSKRRWKSGVDFHGRVSFHS